jgi:hypothetical protein
LGDIALVKILNRAVFAPLEVFGSGHCFGPFPAVARPVFTRRPTNLLTSAVQVNRHNVQQFNQRCEMLTLPKVKEGLRDRLPGFVAAQTGLSRGTVSAIRSGRNANPTYAVLKALSDYLTGEPKL